MCVSTVGEGGEISLVTSSQHLDAVAGTVANLLNIPRNHIYVETRRLGGGFGGKEGNLIHAGLSALGAYVTHHPVCVWLERQFDITNTGKRHPMEMHYRIGLKDGRIHVFEAELYANAGPFLDLSLSVCERAALHLDNAYYIPHASFDIYACRTNTQSNTAFRGFGAPQAILVIEAAIDRACARFGLDPVAVRSKSLYAEAQTCPYGQEVLQTNILHRAWNETLERADYAKLRRQVDAFNAEHTYRKRGLAAMPLKFGISFTQSFLNQASSTVNVYKDGTVLVFAQVTEMGQAAFTKIAQLVADALEMDVTNVHLRRTSTEFLSNASPTSATTATDLHGMAAMLAAQEIAKRLKPFRTEGRTMAQACLAAWLARVPLNETAFYATPMTGYDFATAQGQPFAYYAYGAAVSMVELDTLTGCHRILRADVCYDAGNSLNPAIDIGQVEGAFVQGAGWLTSEEFMLNAKWDEKTGRLNPTGYPVSTGPGTYKIPGIADLPQDFRVRLMDNAPNERAVRLSKGVGEPPFCLGAVVFLALADAVRRTTKKELRAPATPESVRCALPDAISEAVLQREPKSTFDLMVF